MRILFEFMRKKQQILFEHGTSWLEGALLSHLKASYIYLNCEIYVWMYRYYSRKYDILFQFLFCCDF